MASHSVNRAQTRRQTLNPGSAKVGSVPHRQSPSAGSRDSHTPANSRPNSLLLVCFQNYHLDQESSSRSRLRHHSNEALGSNSTTGPRSVAERMTVPLLDMRCPLTVPVACTQSHTVVNQFPEQGQVSTACCSAWDGQLHISAIYVFFLNNASHVTAKRLFSKPELASYLIPRQTGKFQCFLRVPFCSSVFTCVKSHRVYTPHTPPPKQNSSSGRPWELSRGVLLGLGPSHN